ncbi:MAG: hypothetical protein WBO55_04035 [Rhizobiaceae bacterium]
MSSLESAMKQAVSDDIVSEAQAGQLRVLFAARGLLHPLPVADEQSLFPDLDRPLETDFVNPVEESEAPRFVRGFHDVLITIGIGAAIGGLWGLLGPIAAMVAVLVLAEILVKRQRLALPAFVLTLLLAGSVAQLAYIALDAQMPDDGALRGLALFFVMPLALAGYYWRYRVPAALALVIAGIAALAFFLVVVMVEGMAGSKDMFASHPLFIALTALLFACGLFAIAMQFDMKDPGRTTRRSDVAFWLHLATAPALLYAALAVVFHNNTEGWLAGDRKLIEAVIVLSIITLMMVIGIIIDRRAFVTSGLISLGVAIGVIAKEANVNLTDFAALPVFLVGMIVLVLGVGWQRLRALVVGLLPAVIRAKLPPVHMGPA